MHLVLGDGSCNRDFPSLLKDVAGSTEQLQQALFTLEVAGVTTGRGSPRH